MRIDRIEIRQVALPLLYPWRTACGDEWETGSVLVKLASGELEAWGESAPLSAPYYSPEWAGGAFLVLAEQLAPAVLGKEVGSGQELQDILADVKGNHFAKAALDNAWWVLEGRRTGRPLHALLGGTRDRVEVGADFGVMESLDDLLAGIAVAVEAGYRRLKLKFRPGWDLEMLRAVRSSFPGLTTHIDCNSAYSLDDLGLFREIDRLGLAMIEQPLAHDDLVDHAKLQARLETPICLDESVTSDRRAEQALELGSCRYVNVKPGRVGGLTNAVAIVETCREAGVPCWVGGMLESGVGSAICVTLATLENVTYPSDIFPSERFYADDLARPLVEFEAGTDGGVFAVAASVPGIPQEPVAGRLDELTVRQHVLEAR